jgi:hypothetical protein
LSNDIAPWLEVEQINVPLNGFLNNLTLSRNNFSTSVLSYLSNDIAPWLKVEQDAIFISDFYNDLLLFEDNFMESKLSFLSNDIAPWLQVYQSNVNLSEFNNELILREHNFTESKLSYLSNDVAPWIRNNPKEILLSQFYDDLYFSYENILNMISLSRISNDLAPWLLYGQSEIRLSGFSNDLFSSSFFDLKEDDLLVPSMRMSFEKEVYIHSNCVLYNQPKLTFFDTNSDGYWNIYTDRVQNKTCDLVFQSRNKAVVSLSDEFNPSILNFTGQHRCTATNLQSTDIRDLIGKVVISTGKYNNLQNKRTLSVNEAIPVVKLCAMSNDIRAFGVISDEETDDNSREHHFACFKFQSTKRKNTKKYMINSVGEGGIWICNINGNVKNGEYLTTSYIPGYGMRQEIDVHTNYTIAKITCDCDFSFNSDTFECEELLYKGKTYRKAFVGCVYKF